MARPYSSFTHGPHDEWGTVCDDSFDDIDANVICTMFGFLNGTARLGAHFGQGNGSILVNKLRCTGNENSVFDCGSWRWGKHNCHHDQDAGVVCMKNSRRG